MSLGSNKTPFFVDIPEIITPQSESISINPEFVNEIENSMAKPIVILNQSYLKAVEIHEILSSNIELSNSQKFDFCCLGRYFMKKYLKEIVNKLQD